MSLRRRARIGEKVAEGVIRVVGVTSIALLLLILLFVGKEAIPIFFDPAVRKEVTFASLFVASPGAVPYAWQPVSDLPRFNVLPLFVGTLKVTLVSLAVSAPLGIGAAIYVAEYASERARALLKPAIELLAGMPSVVVGFFALVVLATWIQSALGLEHRLNSVVAGVGLAFAVCPVVFSVSEDALRSVPASYRAAALALGSTKAQSVLRVVVPAASPGIAAALVLGFGRAVGETMIVILATGNAAVLDGSVGTSTRTITATIAQELGEVVVGSPHYVVLFMLGALLFLTTLGINLAGERVVSALRRKLGTAND